MKRHLLSTNIQDKVIFSKIIDSKWEQKVSETTVEEIDMDPNIIYNKTDTKDTFFFEFTVIKSVPVRTDNKVKLISISIF